MNVQGAPTGIVFNADPSAFAITTGGKTGRALFIYDTEDGTISAWNPSGVATDAAVVYTSPDGAIYKGLAIATTAAGPRLYATNFRAATVEVFDTTFTLLPEGVAALRAAPLASANPRAASRKIVAHKRAGCRPCGAGQDA